MPRLPLALCWTLNNPTLSEYQALVASVPATVSFLTFQLEVGENGTRHLQGYAEMATATKMATAKKAIGNRAHLEVRQGTQQQAIVYCSKEDTRAAGTSPETYGQPRKELGRGHRSDLDEVCRLIISKEKTEQDIMLEFPALWCRNYRSLRELAQRSQNVVQRQWPTTVLFFTGPTGTGKSRQAHAIAPHAYVKDPSHRWWDGYSGQHDVVIEDMTPEHGLPASRWLTLLDRYATTAEVKGGMVNFAPGRVIITTNYNIEELYPTASVDSMNAIKRRITETVQFGEAHPLGFARVIISNCQCISCKN